MIGGLSGFSGPRFDFQHQGSLKKSYIIAATYRSGSTYLCHTLWTTGLLGAPFEYFNYENEMRVLFSRVNAESMEDYVKKLLLLRTSGNGIFGVKAHFHHFKAALQQYPELLHDINVINFFYIVRRNKIAQAVSLAKAYQTRAWSSLDRETRVRLFYHGEFIEECLKEIIEQAEQWAHWFTLNNIEPTIVFYEDLLQKKSKVVESFVNNLGVMNDEPTKVVLPELERQSDVTNEEWIRKFEADKNVSDIK